MKPDLVVKNAKIVNSLGTYEGHILIKDGKVLAITAALDGEPDSVIDAEGLYVLPGMVDDHVHMMDPGHTEREDFTTGTRAAARGGATTVIEHHRTLPPVFTADLLREKSAYLKDKSVVDFAQLGGLAPDNLDQLRPMWEAGALGFKGFLVELHGAPMLSEGVLLNIMREVRTFDGTCLYHCESDSICRLAMEQIERDGRTDYRSMLDWRSMEAEYVASMDLINLAELTGCRSIIAHVSQPRILEAVQAARRRGVRIYAESCPQYFYLTEEDGEKRGPWAKFTPPPRPESVRDGMRDALGKGMVDILATDHCPQVKADKEKGNRNIHDAPFGIPGIETTSRLMLNAVSSGWLTLEHLVQMMCERPAKLYGIYPKKGALQPGSDADLVIADLDRKETLANDAVVSKCGWTTFDGLETTGAPTLTMVRGNVVMKDGHVVGEAGIGLEVARA
ncbi:MAG: dihydroorotase family protein [Nitrospinota bacterium]